jgi:hypothetical protein
MIEFPSVGLVCFEVAYEGSRTMISEVRVTRGCHPGGRIVHVEAAVPDTALFPTETSTTNLFATREEAEHVALYRRTRWARVIHATKYPEAGAVYIGRPGRGTPGPWGNPVALNRMCPRCHRIHTRSDVFAALLCYEEILRNRLLHDPEFARSFDDLRGQTLACFCSPKGGLSLSDEIRCHGQIMIRVLFERLVAAGGGL